MSLHLGVDGGGTKTAFVLVDERLTVLAEASGPTCYAFPADAAKVRRVLADGVAAVTAAAGVDAAALDSAFFALPGYGEASADVPVLDRVPGEVLGHGRYRVGNDMIAGWAGSLAGADGINVVAGTGSIAYGEWAGRSARSGGWSELFGDEGSGYWIAIRGLNAFSRMSDGRAARTLLHARLLRAFGTDRDFDVIGVVGGEWAGDRTRVAALSRVVVDAAEDGDPVAQGIVADAGRELALLAHAIRAALEVPAGETVPVSYSGGMFTAPTVLAAFGAALGSGYRLAAPVHGPAVGAALVALRGATRP
ncbi:BadF/BadG/BcrA/BcrD ATPase family protein [uncultured Amnibacterium sp.]|uniref:BadF/BadG/BcrA/BcrD ATPase family protein n=1 Tax=uncultured Amnibacterium sp. TaxID=1631851 RepID=UPI0035CC9EFB